MFNVLLQLLDDGRLTDGQGRTVDFTNTVLIMTSNLGTGGATLGVDGLPDVRGDADTARVLDAVRRYFKPEFVNRIDEIVVLPPTRRAPPRADRRVPGRAPARRGSPSATSGSS